MNLHQSYQHSTTTDSSSDFIYHNIPEESPPDDPYDNEIPCIDTKYFDVPTPTANFTTTTHSSPCVNEPIDTSDIIFDPLHYLHYSS